jgi:hypothetical protein
MQFDNVYLKAVRSWLEAHGYVSAAGQLSTDHVHECQVEGMSIAEAAAEALRLMTVLDLVGK